MTMQRTYRYPFFIAVMLHIIIFLVLAMGFEVTGKHYVLESMNSPQVINATVMPSVSNTQVAPAPLPKPIVQPRPLIRQAITKPAPSSIPVQKPHIVPPKKDTIALDTKKQKKIQQEQIQKQLLADLKKQEIEQKKLKQKLKHKELLDAFASDIKNLAKKKPLKNGEQRMAADREQKAQGEVDKYKALVLQAVGKHWLIPSNVDRRLETKLVIYLAPGGMVLNVEIFEGSGNPALDLSARSAVFKASPLPVPSDPEAFNFFRRFVVVFKPMYFDNQQAAL